MPDRIDRAYTVRKLPILPTIPPVADTQPSPGWGFICVGCRHVYSDEEKYVAISPDFPCRKLQWQRGGYDRSTSPPTYNAPCPVFDLVRYEDDSESCPKYEEKVDNLKVST